MTEILRRKQDLCPPFTPIICRGSGSTSRQSLTCLPQKRTEGLLPGERPGSLLARRLGSEAAGKAREKDVAAAQRAHRVLLSPHLCTANQTLAHSTSFEPPRAHTCCVLERHFVPLHRANTHPVVLRDKGLAMLPPCLPAPPRPQPGPFTQAEDCESTDLSTYLLPSLRR